MRQTWNFDKCVLSVPAANVASLGILVHFAWPLLHNRNVISVAGFWRWSFFAHWHCLQAACPICYYCSDICRRLFAGVTGRSQSATSGPPGAYRCVNILQVVMTAADMQNHGTGEIYWIRPLLASSLVHSAHSTRFFVRKCQQHRKKGEETEPRKKKDRNRKDAFPHEELCTNCAQQATLMNYTVHWTRSLFGDCVTGYICK